MALLLNLTRAWTVPSAVAASAAAAAGAAAASAAAARTAATRAAATRTAPGGCPPGESRGAATEGGGATVYGGPSAAPTRRVSLRDFERAAAGRGRQLAWVTAYDYPSSASCEAAGADVLLVGDSVGMVVHGLDTTVAVTLDMMVMHAQAVVRGRRHCFVVADLPFGSYEACATQAVRSAVRLMKEGGVDAVKVEGGSEARVAAVRAISDSGIAAVGHIGLTPQSVSRLGGFRPQGKTAQDALRIVREARELERAGAVALVVECVPPTVAAAVTAAVRGIPTIGIGAGQHVTGQVLVYHDVVGLTSHPHHEKAAPKFCKRYGSAGAHIVAALREYVRETRAGAFPSAQYSPYRLPEGEEGELARRLEEEGLSECAEAMRAAGAAEAPR